MIRLLLGILTMAALFPSFYRNKSHSIKKDKKQKFNSECVVLKGHIAPDELVMAYFSDQYDELQSFIWRSDSGGNFTKKIPVKKPQLAALQRNGKNSYVWLIPNDTIMVFNPVNSVHQFSLSTSHFRYNNILNFLYTYSKKYDFRATDISYTSGMNMYYYDSLCTSYKNAKLFLLKKESRKNDMFSYFERNFYLTIYGNYILQLLLPFSLPTIDYNNIPSWYIKKLLSYKNNFLNEDNLTCYVYRLAVFNYNKFLSEYYYKDLSIQHQFKSANKFFSGKTRDFILYKIMKDNLKRFLPNYTAYLDTFNMECLSKDYVHHLDSLYQIFSIASTPDSINQAKFLTTAKQKISLAKIINANKGKVILVDFWATWCGPCKYQLPYLKKIGQKFDRHEFSIVDISLDLSIMQWKQFLDTSTYLTGRQYYSINGFNNPLARLIGMRSIPRYMLVNKKGQIIDTDAPRPSDTRIYDIIEKLINQQQL